MEAINQRDPIVFIENVDSLCKLALLSVKLSLHRIAIISRHLNKSSKYPNSLSKLISAPLPDAMKNSINKSFWRMEGDSQDWWSYHKERIFFDSSPTDLGLFNLFDQLVWLPDESIHYKRTAQKMMSSPKLTSTQKFRMAALYCLADDVESAWRSLTKTEVNALTEEMGSPTRQQHFVIRYWFDECSDESNVRKQNRNVAAVLQKTVDYETSPQSPQWSTIEYFFDRLEQAERRRAIERTVGGRPEFHTKLLAKLTGAELDWVLKVYGELVLLRLAKEPKNEKCTLAVWKRMVPVMNERTVRSVFGSTLCVSLLPVQHAFETEYQVRLSFEMWQCLDDELKTRLARSYADEMIVPSKFHGCGCRRRPIYFDLIVDVLTRRDFQYTSDYWTRYWDRFIGDCFHHKDHIEKIMALCFANRTTLNNFKRDVMCEYSFIRPYCDKLLEKGQYDELQGFLEVCSDDPAVTSSLKKKIFEIPDVHTVLIQHLLHEDVWQTKRDSFDRLIEGTFDDETSTKRFKRLLVTMPENLAKLQKDVHRGFFDRVISYVDRYLTDEEEISAVKLQLVESFRRVVSGCHTALDGARDRWSMFAEWLFNGDSNRIAQFKSSISNEIDKVFAEKLTTIVSLLDKGFFDCQIDEKHLLAPKRRRISKSKKQIQDRAYKEHFANFDKALVWMLGSQDEVARVKSNIMNRKLELDFLMKCLTNGDERVVEAVVDFFASRDAQLKKQFMETLQREKPICFHLFF